MYGSLLRSGLERGLQELSSLPAVSLDAAVQDLLRPTSMLGTYPTPQAGPLPALAALPLSAHLNLLLLLRAAPHRFSAAQQSAILQGLQRVAGAVPGASDPQHATLVQLLAAEAEGSLAGRPPAAAVVPPCPASLYTARPCFPWAPVLTDAATAAALHKQQLKEARRRGLEQEEEARQAADRTAADAAGAAGTAGGKRPAEGNPCGLGATKRSRSPAPPAAAATTTDEAEAELDAAVAAVQAALAGHAAGGAGELTALQPPLRAALEVLLAHAATGSAAGSEALQDAGLGSLGDDSLLLLLLSDLITPASSFARCRAAASGLLLPRLAGLAGPAARDLAAATQHVGSTNPQALIAACLRPLLSSPGLLKHQAELLAAVLKASLPQALLPEVLAAACAAPTSGPPAAAAGGAAWNEHTVGVLQVALNAKPPLGSAAVAQLADACGAAAAASAELAGSAKLAKLLLSLVKQYPSAAGGAKQQLQAAARATSCFMTKPLLAAVARL